jgi:hypothetical protein
MELVLSHRRPSTSDGKWNSVPGVTTKNPFPGMNPFCEQRWRGAHTALITYIRDALQERLPQDLIAAPEEEVVTIGAEGRSVTYRPDVQVQQPWTLREPGGAEAARASPHAPAELPIRVLLEKEVERWIEIRDKGGRLITVLELLSPSNKLEWPERERYLRKRHAFIAGGANFVEIDLVRQGGSVFPQGVRHVLERAGACYGVCVFRATNPTEREVYPIGLRERLPAIHVPLRSADGDVSLELQALIDQCHERGRYHLLNYRLALEPPLPHPDAVWADELLRRHGLVSD